MVTESCFILKDYTTKNIWDFQTALKYIELNTRAVRYSPYL